jgi:hypothetical protein
MEASLKIGANRLNSTIIKPTGARGLGETMKSQGSAIEKD